MLNVKTVRYFGEEEENDLKSNKYFKMFIV